MRSRLLTRLTQIPGVRTIWKAFPLGSVATRVRYDIFDRPQYAYGIWAGADLAKRLGLDAVQVVEFGVAGGSGLIALERIAAIIESSLAIQIHVCGFDTGTGMPPPIDYRDLPYVWNAGFYAMDIAALKAKLNSRTELVLGDLKTTIGSWKPSAPVAFAAFDLDYYSSTKDALALFDRSTDQLLPRVYTYFDDVVGPAYACQNDRLGELCAIREFNLQHTDKTLCPIHMFRHTRPHQSPWNDQIYVLHDFKHPLYCRNITPLGDRYRQLSLE